MCDVWAWRAATLVAVCAAWAAGAAAAATASGARYGFIRPVDVDVQSAGTRRAEPSRRVFGGSPAELRAWGAVCSLLDRYWSPRCSGTVLAPRWALTAAHCITPHVAYVKYNARRPAAPEGDVAPAHYLYRHPGYKVVQEDEGRGPDVVLLQHDVGLVRTRIDMTLINKPTLDPLRGMHLYKYEDLWDAMIQVLGFGRTERSSLGEELCSVRLNVVACERNAWKFCVCGSSGAGGAGGAVEGEGSVLDWGGRKESSVTKGRARGVCAGDSGGPVLARGALVALTSMGPVECQSPTAAPPESATSVFTTLYGYADMLNDTIHDTDAALMMRIINAGPVAAPRSLAVLAAVAATLAVRHGTAGAG